MHPAAEQFIQLINGREYEKGKALDVGGRNVNGECRSYWPNLEWEVIDKFSDNIANIANIWDYTTGPYQYEFYDLVLCTEVLEHVEKWHLIVKHAWQDLKSGGTLVLTCAGPYRMEHSAMDGGELRDDEYYGNIHPMALHKALLDAGFTHGRITYNFGEGVEDLYVIATKA